jgi:hypothetical protein
MQNGITTASAYAALTQAIHLKLPSGAVFLVRRPTLGYRLQHPELYQSIAARSHGQTSTDRGYLTTAEMVRFYYDLLQEVCIEPRISLNPQEGELHPEAIQFADATFIARWAGGEVSADGADLAEFRGSKSAAASAAVAGGGDVALPPERTAGWRPVKRHEPAD